MELDIVLVRFILATMFVPFLRITSIARTICILILRRLSCCIIHFITQRTQHRRLQGLNWCPRTTATIEVDFQPGDVHAAGVNDDE
ncbi:hypothetical protein D3C75_1071990 [compost metagenome]